MDTLDTESIDGRPLGQAPDTALTEDVAALLDAPPASKGRFNQAIVMLVASFVLFVGAESFAFGAAATQIVAIVAVLLVHELGHLAASDADRRLPRPFHVLHPVSRSRGEWHQDLSYLRPACLRLTRRAHSRDSARH